MVKGIKAGGNKRRIAIIIPCAIIFTFIASIALLNYELNKTIGTFSGSEYEIITIGEDTYKANYDNVYHSSDKGRLLGRVLFDSKPDDKNIEPMYVWEIKGTDNYIYASWAYDGTIYKKVQ
ncbi:MAG: hypothetical protein IKG30_05590 [Clostridiales bacterium]|nr:hypothetical protein [Clostridiales bacterium]